MRRRLALAAAALALAAWCGWVSGFHRTTVAAEATWVVSTVAVLVVACAFARGRRHAPTSFASLEPATQPWPRPGRGGGRRALTGVAPWLVLVLVALTWDVLGIDTGPRQYHLTISALAQAYRPLNAGLLLVWMLAGVGYAAARARAPRAGPGPWARAVPPESRTMQGAGLVGLAVHPGRAAAPGLLLPPSEPVGLAFWVAVPVAAVVIDVMARRSTGATATGEEFVRFISSAPWARVLLVAGWLLAGYHLFAR